ncbi:hypothetical protein NHX12_010204 [Muraenolepis orangiensis]|uniref:PDZ domain-containing protein n=1 Tax=Muraenolepis orangiensis TaxID=630683 RepID=A0A9Q0I873_9TELE|nr:hypothetical protein NHX12_010204 [Muraenolepis orangiensis]
MFHLIKKEKERESLKKEKKDKKDGRMSPGDLQNLEEMSVRRGFFNLPRSSSKRETRSKLEISSPIPIKVATDAEFSLTDIQAERFLAGELGGVAPVVSSGDLQEVEQDLRHRGGSVKDRAAMFEPISTSQGVYSVPFQPLGTGSEEDGLSDTRFIAVQHSAAVTSSLPEDAGREHPQQHLQGQATRVPELVEKTFPGADLQLPAVGVQPAPQPRQLEVRRRNTGDFGFSLRRTALAERQAGGRVGRRVVHFAEPGAGTGTKDRSLGLVPGDRLVEINGVGVESHSRDEIVEMIRRSGDSVRLKVQPIAELSELNRCWLRNNDTLPRHRYDQVSTQGWSQCGGTNLDIVSMGGD